MYILFIPIIVKNIHHIINPDGELILNDKIIRMIIINNQKIIVDDTDSTPNIFLNVIINISAANKDQIL